jgi:RNA polymerase sigma factor (sigma-70 family)
MTSTSLSMTLRRAVNMKLINGDIDHQCDGTGMDEAALIRKIVGGHRHLFGDLIAPHVTALSRMIRLTIGGHTEVEDIVQQTILQAFTHLAQFRFEAGFKTWLIRIGINEARQWRRKYPPSRFLAFTPRAFSELPIADQSCSPFIECLRRETDAQLGVALAHLPEKYRNVVLLRDLEGLSISEAAMRLGLTRAAVKSRQFRARRKVAEFLEQAKSVDRGDAFAGLPSCPHQCDQIARPNRPETD